MPHFFFPEDQLRLESSGAKSFQSTDVLHQTNEARTGREHFVS
jgi:hypothetical protein